MANKSLVSVQRETRTSVCLPFVRCFGFVLVILIPGSSFCQTFSDADWISLNPATTAANDYVNAIVADRRGNVYIGGSFTSIGTVPATNIAKWNGTTWSPLGSGVPLEVNAL